ncbi:unnamed protein product, partial [Oppiella nova]
MIDMKYILKTSMKWVSLFTTFETTGFVLGTFVAAAVIPLSTYLWVLFICAFVIGFSSSVFVSCIYVWGIELWRDSKVPIVQILELMFGIGSVLSTVALKPFIIGETHNQTIVSTDELIIDVNDVIDRRNRLMFPTLLIGASIITRNSDNSDIQTTHEDSTSTVKLFDRSGTPKKTIRLLFALFFSLYLVYENVYMKFAVPYFQYSPLRLSADKAAEVYSVSATVYSVGLVLNIFYPYKFQMRTIIAAHYILAIIGTLLLIPGQWSMGCLWAASIVMNLGFSAMYAGIVTMAEQYFDMTSKLSA